MVKSFTKNLKGGFHMRKLLLGLLLFWLLGAVSVYASTASMDLSSAQVYGNVGYIDSKLTMLPFTPQWQK
jgi:hypothetical protein